MAINPYKDAYEREKKARKETEKLFLFRLDELKSQNRFLKSANNKLTEIYHKTDINQDLDLILNNPNPIYKLDLSLNVLFSNKKGYEIIEYYNHSITKIFPFLDDKDVEELKHFGNLDKRVYIKESAFNFSCVLKPEAEEISVYGVDVSKYASNFKSKEIESSYRKLVKSINDVLFKTDNEGNFILVNTKGTELTGYSEKELLTMNFQDLLSDECRDEVTNHYVNLAKNRIRTNYHEFEIITKYGEKVWLGQNITLKFIGSRLIEIVAVARDITQVRTAKKALENSEEKYRNTIENLHFGLMEVNNEDEISKVYKGMIELTGYSEEELLGSKALELLLTDDSKEVMKHQIKERNKGKSGVYEVQIKRKDGALRWTLISGTPMYNEENKKIGSLGMHVDITEHKRIESELRKAENKAIESLKSKEIFLAKMSHELRTPLNAILGFSELIRNNTHDELVIKQIEPVHSSAQHLLDIVNDILDFTKLNQSKIVIEEIPFSITTLVQELVKMFTVEVKKKDIEFSAEIPDYIPIVNGDPTRLRQIINNLISNAVKFTNEGGVKLHMDFEVSEDNLLLEVKIEDTGIGIKKSNLQRIFKEFEQEEIGTTRNFGGTGLGLPIVKGLIEQLNGDLQIGSTVDKGTTIIFKLEYKLANQEDENQDINLQKEEIELKNYHVLVVDDNEFNLLLAESLLNDLKAYPTIASSGKMGIELLNNATDIVLMDIQMPEMNGIQAATIIKEKYPNLPIVALTADLIGDHQERTELFDGFLSKPYTQQELFDTIQGCKKQDKTYNLSELDKLFPDDPEMVKKMLITYCANSEMAIKDLNSLFDTKNWDGIKAIAHKLKPSLHTIGVTYGLEAASVIDKADKAKISEACLKYTPLLLDSLSDSITQLKKDFHI